MQNILCKNTLLHGDPYTLQNSTCKNRSIYYNCKTLPPIHILQFLNSIQLYNIYCVIDDNSKPFNVLNKYTFPNIVFLQYDSAFIKSQGYSALTSIIEVSAIDKAMYHACTNSEAKYVWFIEDDVFFL